MSPNSHAFNIKPDRLKAFLEKVNESDSLGGNKVIAIKDLGHQFVVVISREYQYPFIINQLRTLEQWGD